MNVYTARSFSVRVRCVMLCVNTWRIITANAITIDNRLIKPSNVVMLADASIRRRERLSDYSVIISVPQHDDYLLILTARVVNLASEATGLSAQELDAVVKNTIQAY